MQVNHYQADVYVRENYIPKGTFLKNFVHSYDHLSVLASGVITLLENNIMSVHYAPCVIPMKANTVYKMIPVTDVVYYCIHHNTKELPDMEQEN